MADEQDKATADVPAEPALESVELPEPIELGDVPPELAESPEPVELEDLPLSEAEQVAIAAAGARPVRRTAVVETKGHATRTRAEATARENRKKRTTPAQFVQESIEELKKVVWPTLSQWQQYFIVVLVFVLFMIAIVTGLDLLFGWALFQVFG